MLIHQATAQTYWTDSYLYFKQNYDVRNGAFKALFASPDDPQQTCWNSFVNVKVAYQSFLWDKESKGLEAFFLDVSTIMNFQTRCLEFYTDCQFDYMLVQLGIRTNTISGFLNMVVNMLFRYFQALDNAAWQQDIIDAIDKANYSDDSADWEAVGSYLGVLFADFMDFAIPDTTLEYYNYI